MGIIHLTREGMVVRAAVAGAAGTHHCLASQPNRRQRTVRKWGQTGKPQSPPTVARFFHLLKLPQPFKTALSVRGQVFKYVSLWGTFCIQNSTIISQEVPPPPPHPPKLELTRQHGFDQTVLTGQPLLSWHQALYEAWGTRTYEARPTLGISHSSPAR